MFKSGHVRTSNQEGSFLIETGPWGGGGGGVWIETGPDLRFLVVGFQLSGALTPGKSAQRVGRERAGLRIVNIGCKITGASVKCLLLGSMKLCKAQNQSKIAVVGGRGGLRGWS